MMSRLFDDTINLSESRLRAQYSAQPHGSITLVSRSGSMGSTRAMSISPAYVFLCLEAAYFESCRRPPGQDSAPVRITKANTLRFLRQWLGICCGNSGMSH